MSKNATKKENQIADNFIDEIVANTFDQSSRHNLQAI